MYIIYNYGFYKIKLTSTEAMFKNNGIPIICDGFLDNYTLHTDGFYYPNIVLNKTLQRVFMNDDYNEFTLNNESLIATHTAYTITDILTKNNWFIDVSGYIRALPSEAISNYYIHKQLENYTGVYLCDTTYNKDNVLPYKNTTLSLVADDTGDKVTTLGNYFNFTINTDLQPTAVIIFYGYYDNGEPLQNN